MAAVDTWQITWHQLESQQNRDRRQTNTLHDFLMPGGGKLAGGSSKLRGQTNDSPEVRLSKTLAWILRHGAKSEGLPMRPDGYIRVTHLLENPRLQGLDFSMLQRIVEADSKKRYDLMYEGQGNTASSLEADSGIWWMRANQGHSMKSVQVELRPVHSSADIAMAVHGTTLQAWKSISTQGLSKMSRNHIHLAQGVGGNVMSGMRRSSQILIYIDVDKAISAGIKFFLSANDVVLTAGDEHGFLAPQFFSRVEDADRVVLPGWENKHISVAT